MTNVRMVSLLAIAALCTMPLSDRDAALADYQAQPVVDRPYVRYLTVSNLPEDKKPMWIAAGQYQIPSASREIVLDHQLPYNLPGTNLFRINLQRLGWAKEWDKVISRYDYSDKKYPLIVRMDWLVKELADTRESDAYYRLLYGSSIPTNVNEFLKSWNVDGKQQAGHRFGWAEEKSQVSTQGKRYIERFNAAGHALWITKDVFQVTRETDPIEHLDGNFKHDGREAIVQIPKVSTYMQLQGAAQVYALFNAQDKVVNEAPSPLVVDFGNTLGHPTIINNASCVTCHTNGMNPPTVNGLKSLIVKGVELKTYDKKVQETIEAFHLTDTGKELDRNNEDYADFIEACNGLTPAANAANYKRALHDYIAEVTPERAAQELYCSVEDMTNALAYASDAYLDVGPRVAALAHGSNIPRDTFEQEYRKLSVYIQTWRSK